MLDEETLEILNRFDVHPSFGFVLPDPLTRLPEKFAPWHEIADELPELLENGLVEDRIRQLPLIATDTLTTDNELRLAHLLLVTLAAGHVWQHGPNQAKLSIPANISFPLLDVSKRLGLKPIVCHASACLANWKPLLKMATFEAEHADIIAFRFLRHPANRWFFTFTAQMETELAPGLRAVASACQQGKIDAATLRDIRDSVEKATRSIECMDEHVPPDVFYNGFRYFLSGYTHKAFAEQGGIIFEGHEELGPQPLNGGSAAQSSAFHVIDEFLGIQHAGTERAFLECQRSYMPPKHREFILWVQQNAKKISNLRDSAEYQETVLAVRKFREAHINLVRKYIVLPAGNDREVGTGGSSFMRLLFNIAADCNG